MGRPKKEKEKILKGYMVESEFEHHMDGMVVLAHTSEEARQYLSAEVGEIFIAKDWLLIETSLEAGKII